MAFVSTASEVTKTSVVLLELKGGNDGGWGSGS